MRYLPVIDSVCRCSLGVVGAMMELSGVYLYQNTAAGTLLNYPNYTTADPSANQPAGAVPLIDVSLLRSVPADVANKRNVLQSEYGWAETTTAKTPKAFACTQTYATYYLLLQFLFAQTSSGDGVESLLGVDVVSASGYPSGWVDADDAWNKLGEFYHTYAVPGLPLTAYAYLGQWWVLCALLLFLALCPEQLQRNRVTCFLWVVWL
jgi:hypothetical protein